VDCKEIGCESVDWIWLAQDGVPQQALLDIVMALLFL
jgi:hypothetical protein